MLVNERQKGKVEPLMIRDGVLEQRARDEEIEGSEKISQTKIGFCDGGINATTVVISEPILNNHDRLDLLI